MPDESRICTFIVSLAVMAVSAVSMCSQNESDAVAAFEGIVTACCKVSVCAEPYPSSHAFQLPVCGVSKLELSITPAVTVHGAGFEDSFSNPVLPSKCCYSPSVVATVHATAVI